MYTGLTGKVKIGKGTAAYIAYISNWSVEDTSDIIEFAELGKPFKKKAAGLQTWSASADGAVEFTSDAHTLLFDAKHKGDKVLVELYLNDGQLQAADTMFFKGYGYIESLSVDLSAEDKGNISISINGSGELVLYHNTAAIVGDVTNLDSGT